MLKANFHTHTTLCDGHDTPNEVAAMAVQLGMTQLGFSGHMDVDIHMDWPVYLQTINELKRKYAGQLDILCGVELDRHMQPDAAPGAEYAIASTHFVRCKDGQLACVDWDEERSRKLCETEFGGDWYKLCAEYFAQEAQVVDVLGEHVPRLVIGHFDLVSKFNDRMHAFDETDARYVGPALEAMHYLAVEKDVAFEINTGAYVRGLKSELYPRQELLCELARMGGRIFINADAHHKEYLMGGFAKAYARAKKAGFTQVYYYAHSAYGEVEERAFALDE